MVPAAAVMQAMLFLRHVESIEVYVWHPGQPKPTLRQAVQLGEMTSEKRRLRDGIASLPKPLNLGAIAAPAQYATTVRLQIVTTRYPERGGAPPVVAMARWWIRQALGSGRAMAMATDPRAAQYEVSLLPWGGVAMRVSAGAALCLAAQPGRLHMSLQSERWCA